MEDHIEPSELRMTSVGSTPGRLRRCQSADVMWNQLEKKYYKIGKNGYKLKDVNAKIVRPTSLNGIDKNIQEQESSSLELFHVNGNNTGDSDTPGSSFVGRRNVLDPGTLREHQIVSSKGTVRGYKNRVRAGLATFFEQIQPNDLKKDYRQLEKGKIIVYTTTMTVVRQTSERCKWVKKILQNHMVRYEERDMYMSKDIQKELSDRLGTYNFNLPQVFADGLLLGGAKELEMLNECGELRNIFQNFTKISVRSSCDKCGGYRFIPCTFCHGSKKSLRRNNFTAEFCALRCMQCDESGLVRCDMCLDQQE